MIKNQGVYTVKCPKCSRSILIHLLSDGSISPKKCFDCQVEFEGLDNGEQRNTFVVVAKEKKKTIFVSEEAEETPKTEEKKSSETFQATKKAEKKPLRW